MESDHGSKHVMSPGLTLLMKLKETVRTHEGSKSSAFETKVNLYALGYIRFLLFYITALLLYSSQVHISVDRSDTKNLFNQRAKHF
jgi:hypothetical protein